MLTRVFKSGNSLAVRIPREVAFLEAAQEVEIERRGDSLVIRPVQARSLSPMASFEACGVPHHVAITGRHRADLARLAADLRRTLRRSS